MVRGGQMKNLYFLAFLLLSKDMTPARPRHGQRALPIGFILLNEGNITTAPGVEGTQEP
jgi:hypothetical protein